MNKTEARKLCERGESFQHIQSLAKRGYIRDIQKIDVPVVARGSVPFLMLKIYIYIVYR